MSVFKKQAVIKLYPAAQIVKREADRKGYINLTDGEKITDSVEAAAGTWTVGSVISYALKSNNCPLKAVERARSNGHDLYYIYANASVLSSSDSERVTKILIEEGDVVCFEGQLFTIKDTFNNNKYFAPYSPE